MLDKRRIRLLAVYLIVCGFIAISAHSFWPKDYSEQKTYTFSFFLIWSFINILFMIKLALPKAKGLLEDQSSESVLQFPKNEWEKYEDKIIQLQKKVAIQEKELLNETTQFEKLVEAFPSSVFVLDHSQNIIYANSKFYDIFAPNTVKSLPSQHLLSLVRDHSLEELAIKALNSKSNESLEISIIPPKEANRFYFDAYLSPLDSFHQTPNCVLVILIETTERRLTDRMREEFVANVSHEIRTPLTILMGHIQSLQNSIQKKDDLSEVSTQITKNSKRLLSMINELLELSKIESQGRITKEEIEIDVLIESILFDLKDKYQDLNLEMLTCFDAQHAFVNPKLFDQLMLNVLENACKYNRINGSVFVHVFNEENVLKIIVKDSGIGIPQDQVHRIFERFFRVDASRSSTIQGTGLGLSIAKHIMQKHQGSIKVQSVLNEGTSFEIVLPHKNTPI